MLIRGADEMRGLGRKIGRDLVMGDVVLLHGDLGAGKTTLAKGIAESLSVDGDAQSPTFTLVADYPAHLVDGTPMTLHHLDLYRLDDPDQLDNIGWEELIDPGDDVTIVEWPERAGDWLPDRYLLVTIGYRGADCREVSISGVPNGRGEP